MSKITPPLVSAYVTCFNQAKYVVKTLESVRAQTYPNMELIVCDDCSSDGSQEIIKRWLSQNWPDAKFIEHKKNVGICRTFNDVLSTAEGKYLAGVAGDDLWIPEKTALQVDILESCPSHIGVVYSDALIINDAGVLQSSYYIKNEMPTDILEALGISNSTGACSSRLNQPRVDSCGDFGRGGGLIEQKARDAFNVFLHRNVIPAMTAMVKKKCYEKVGRYDEKLFFEDWDMWVRIARHFSFAFMEKETALYRIHEASAMRSRQAEIGMSMEAMFRKFAKKHWLRGTDREEYGEACLERYADRLYRDSSPGRHAELLQLSFHFPNREHLFMCICSFLGMSYERYQIARKRISRK